MTKAEDIFSEKFIPFRGSKNIFWCELCQDLCIVCEACHHSSCNGGGCDMCLPVHKKFDEVLNKVLEL